MSKRSKRTPKELSVKYQFQIVPAAAMRFRAVALNVRFGVGCAPSAPDLQQVWELKRFSLQIPITTFRKPVPGLTSENFSGESPLSHHCKRGEPMMFEDHFQLGNLLIEALAVEADIRKRLAKDPKNPAILAEAAEAQRTVMRLADAYVGSVERYRRAAENLVPRVPTVAA
jgi:hypothetical protein